ncbi:hypothetical protein [Fusobacterium canifelinum]|uniref:Uncharacterized protein n=1 Tax=Fusobacterium canifelinum TaxID=285729 RepID=A0A3P1V4X3_9FUSO|nr:hypothetical protein [Fusobacterium canifelinum]RRD28510.1 hypothetical protein EII27_02515 [Fusobacterium canifelinum]
MLKKEELLQIFREKGKKILQEIELKNKKEKTNLINSEFNKFKLEIINKNLNDIEKQERLELVLLINYVSNIVMLECRNEVWEYDYMTFSRRIGELWEPFCKLSFEYSILPLEIITPMSFNEFEENIKKKGLKFIDSLEVKEDIKDKLIEHYEIPWKFVDSGNIKLELDLHFTQNKINYNCDFKSGFNSNEKGNTNRLLLVASLYNYLGENEKTILFVRQNEDDNNHYLLKLKNSGKWDVYCANDAYDAMKKFTGFNLREWLNKNVNLEEDLTPNFRKFLEDNNLLKYLNW